MMFLYLHRAFMAGLEEIQGAGLIRSVCDLRHILTFDDAVVWLDGDFREDLCASTPYSVFWASYF
jgi:hypothetical protein